MHWNIMLLPLQGALTIGRGNPGRCPGLGAFEPSARANNDIRSWFPFSRRFPIWGAPALVQRICMILEPIIGIIHWVSAVVYICFHTNPKTALILENKRSDCQWVNSYFESKIVQKIVSNFEHPTQRGKSVIGITVHFNAFALTWLCNSRY